MFGFPKSGMGPGGERGLRLAPQRGTRPRPRAYAFALEEVELVAAELRYPALAGFRAVWLCG